MHPAFAEYDRKVFRLPAGKLHARNTSGEVDDGAIARLRRPGHRFIANALLAQDIERAIDVAGLDRRNRPLDLGAGKIPERDLRIHLEHCRKFELVLRRGFLGLDLRISRHAQILRPDRVVEARLHGIRNDVRAHLRAILLRDHLHRHLARTKAGDLRRLGEARKTLLYLAFDLFNRHRDVQPAFELPKGLQCHLHTR